MIRCIGNFGEYKMEAKEVVIKEFVSLRQDHYKKLF